MYRLIGPCCIALLVSCGDNPKPPPPSLSNVTTSTAEDTQLVVMVPLTATDTSAVTLSIVTAPSHGTFTGNGPTWTYMPAANYNGPDTVVVKAEDRYGDSTATVAITVTPVNDAPVANPDSFTAAFGVPLTIAQATLLANDTDIDSTTLTVTSVAAAAGGHGTPTMNGTDVVFASEAGFAGSTTFTYTISDGQLSAQGTVTVQIGADQPPRATDDAVTTDEDVTAAIADATLLANDTDPEHHTLAVSDVGNALHGTVSHAGTQVSFVPDANYNGPASFDYTITDGTLTSTAHVAITVNAVDDPPVAVDDAVTLDESATATTIDVLANDTDIDGGPKAVASIGTAAHGNASFLGGVISYSSGIGYCNGVPNGAADTFTYTLTPGGATGTVSVRVTCACGLKKSTDFVVGSN